MKNKNLLKTESLTYKLSFFFFFLSLIYSGCVSKKHTPELISRDDYLDQNFLNPPDSTKPWCYWYWISGHISKEGITKDLEAMAKAGIGEALIGNIEMGEPLGKVKLLSEEWWQLTEHAIREGKRLGVDIGMFNSPGWSQSGGPWIKSDQAMRFLVSSETMVQGGKIINQKLIVPRDTFQDVAVIAFPRPLEDAKTITDDHLIISSNHIINDIALLANKETIKPCLFPYINNKDSLIIDLETKNSFIVRSLTLTPAESPFIADVIFQVWKGNAFQSLSKFEYNRSNPNINVGPIPFGPLTIAVNEVEGNKFRLVFKNIRGKDLVPGIQEIPWKAGLTEITLSASPKLAYYIEKQLGKMHQTPLALWKEYQWPEQDATGTEALSLVQNEIIDLTKNLQADGTLNWNAPSGEWIVMRIGVSPTGTKNGPASAEATGFEVDKMNKKYLAHHFDSYIGKILKDMPAEDRTAFKHVVADSYEMGSQNYTEGFIENFTKRYGYNPIPWFAVLNGRIVGSSNQSNRFLWDMRRFIADEVAYNYVGGLRELSMKNGLKVWLENYGHWGFPSEFLMYGGQSNEIAGEFWTEGTLGNIECRAASSAAHIYGVNRVYAESFTGAGNAFSFYPAKLKKRGDWSFTEGINHVLLHVYIHQPYEDKNPGMNAWFGTEFNRKNTWFDQSKNWIDYLRRNMFMLQQGKPVNDVCYFIGEDAPKMTGIRDPELPKGYSYDYINAEVILNRMAVKDGQWVLPDGMTYKLMVLPKLETMRPALLKKIKELVAAGGKILGPKPKRSPSLEDFPIADQQVSALSDELWGTVNAKSNKFRPFGKGLIMNGLNMQEALDQIKVLPDLELKESAPILWTHRSTADSEIYFITNQSDQSIAIEPIFRVSGKQPELFDAVTGSHRILPQFNEVDQRTKVQLSLAASQSYFVVFRHTASVVEGLNFPKTTFIQSIKTPWQVQFNPANGGPEKPVQFNSLSDWSLNEDRRIRYYSGTAFYHNSFQAPKLPKGTRLLLKLTEVKNMARIKINGKYMGGIWTAPLQLDITDAIIKGKNTIEIEVVNLWVNRLIGDAKLPINEQKTWLHFNDFKPDQHLEPSGLIGDVGLESIKY